MKFEYAMMDAQVRLARTEAALEETLDLVRAERAQIRATTAALSGLGKAA